MTPGVFGPSPERRAALVAAGVIEPTAEDLARASASAPELEPVVVAELEPDAVELAPVTAPAPSAVFKVRLIIGNPGAGGMGNILHILTSQPPDKLHVNQDGSINLEPWGVIDRPDAADKIVFLSASMVAGVSFRQAATPKAIAKALQQEPPAPELAADPSTLLKCPAIGCGETNVPRRFRCRRCGCNLASVKPKPKRRKASATDEAPTTADAVERVRSARARQCLSCGSWQTSRGASACWQCNATLGDA